MPVPTSREPVNEIKRVSGWHTKASPTDPPGPGRKFSTFLGRPASCMISANFAATTGEVLAGLSTTVLPVTRAAVVMPAAIANGKFHGGITTPTPSGMYRTSFSSPSNGVTERAPPSRIISRP